MPNRLRPYCFNRTTVVKASEVFLWLLLPPHTYRTKGLGGLVTSLRFSLIYPSPLPRPVHQSILLSRTDPVRVDSCNDSRQLHRQHPTVTGRGRLRRLPLDLDLPNQLHHHLRPLAIRLGMKQRGQQLSSPPPDPFHLFVTALYRMVHIGFLLLVPTRFLDADRQPIDSRSDTGGCRHHHLKPSPPPFHPVPGSTIRGDLRPSIMMHDRPLQAHDLSTLPPLSCSHLTSVNPPQLVIVPTRFKHRLMHRLSAPSLPFGPYLQVGDPLERLIQGYN